MNTIIQTASDFELFDGINKTGCSCSQILIVDDIDMNRFMISEIIRCNFGLSSD